MVGGRYGSSRGSTAKRLMTSSAAAAFSSRTVDPARVPGLHDPAAVHVGEVERPAVAAARRLGRAAA